MIHNFFALTTRNLSEFAIWARVFVKASNCFWDFVNLLLVLVIESFLIYCDVWLLCIVSLWFAGIEVFYLFKLFCVLVGVLVGQGVLQKCMLFGAMDVVWVSYSGSVIGIKLIGGILLMKDCVMRLAIVDYMECCIAIVNTFIFVLIILSTTNISVAWKFLSSCWRLFLKSSFICFCFQQWLH